jgi:pilus assembly protein CpaE
MFARAPRSSAGQPRRLRVVSADAAFVERLKPALAALPAVQVDATPGPRGDAAYEALRGTALAVVDLGDADEQAWAAFEKAMARLTDRPAIVLVSNKLGDTAARRLLKLDVSDWLHRESPPADIAQAVRAALDPANNGAQRKPATCLAFQSAVGGAGSTTLAIAAASAQVGKANGAGARACVVDLNFQSGAVADYLDVEPNLDLDEIGAAPERLDAHLLEVMLSRHASGLSVLAARPQMDRDTRIAPETVARLLDLAAGSFDHVVVDLPRQWTPWSEVIVKGVDKYLIVTELTIPGLRQARRMVDTLGERYGLATKASVIVNKRPMFAGTVRTKHAKDLLGPALAGFVPLKSKVTREAQDRGVPLSAISRRNGVESALDPLLERR